MSSESNFAKRDRHCAYCLKFLPSGTAKVCGKCHRRAYCSKECQSADWKQGKGSQGHKNWCDLKCGEEDIDWEIRPVPGKGLGMIAKRPIPSKSRIIVDAIRPHDHPAINDLMPIFGSLEQKVKFNAFGDDDGNENLCLRFARINHSCDPNAAQLSEDNLDVCVLIAERDIEPGEEITVHYYYGDFKGICASMWTTKTMLKMKWDIVCEPRCLCWNKNFWKTYKESYELYRECRQLTVAGNVDGAMKVIRKLIGNLDTVRASWSEKMNIFFDAFETGIMTKATLKEAVEYLRRANEISDAIWHPKSANLMQWKALISSPWLNQNYLILEKK